MWYILINMLLLSDLRLSNRYAVYLHTKQSNHYEQVLIHFRVSHCQYIDH